MVVACGDVPQNRKRTIGCTTNVLILTLVLVVMGISIPSTHAESKGISFDLRFGYVQATLTGTITVPDGYMIPGDVKIVDIDGTFGMMTIELTVPRVGSVSMDVDALGEHEYPVPGLYYDYGAV